MDIVFKCHTLLHIPRNGTTIIGRRSPIASWDNVLISKKHVQIHVNSDGVSLDLSVTGRNAVVVERQERADSWDVLAVVDPGAAAVLPLATLATNRATRLYVMGAREESAIELRPAGCDRVPPANLGADATEGEEATPGATTMTTTAVRAAKVTSAAAMAAASSAAREAAGPASPPHGPPAKRTRRQGPTTSNAAVASPAAVAVAAATPSRRSIADSGSANLPTTPSADPSTGPSTSAAGTLHPGAAAGATGRPAPSSAAVGVAAASAVGTAPSAAPYDIESPFHLLRVRGLSPRHNAGCLGARLHRLVAGPGLQLALVSNYMIDMGWLMSCCSHLAGAAQFFVVHGEGPDREPEMRQEAAAAGATHVAFHRPPLPIAYGTHHSKAFLLTYPTGLRLIIETANAIYADCNDKSQGLWVQDFPRKNANAAAVPPSAFECDLASYFRALALPTAMAVPVMEAIAAHDFRYARGALVPSVPGYHRGADVHSYGHMRLRQLLARMPLPPDFRGAGDGGAVAAGGGGNGGDVAGGSGEGLVIQCSSMGSFDQAWLLDEFGASLAAHRRGQQGPQPTGGLGAIPRPSGPPGCGPLPLAVVWPTVDEVCDSIEGWNAGRSIPGPAKNVYKPFMRRYYARWGGETVGRQRAMPHIKTYARYRGQQLAWFLVTSHNLSKAAWGELQKNCTQLMIRSYELGVLVTPDLEAAYRSSPQFGFCCTANSSHPHQPQQVVKAPAATAASPTVSFWAFAAAAEARLKAMQAGEVACVLPVPYTLPPTPYRAGQDQPWTWDQPQAGVDALGQPWGVPFSHYGHKEPASDD